MLNSYEAAETTEIGSARELILGPKPVGTMDSVSELSYFHDPYIVDDDECDLCE